MAGDYILFSHDWSTAGQILIVISSRHLTKYYVPNYTEFTRRRHALHLIMILEYDRWILVLEIRFQPVPILVLLIVLRSKSYGLKPTV